MQTYSCTPKAQNHRAHIALCILSFCLLVVSALLVFGIGILLLNQSLFLIFSGALAYLIIKYFVTSYTYTVTVMKNDPVLIVTKTQGRRTTTVYHGELSALKDLAEYGTGDSVSPRVLRVDIRYSFFVSMSPSRWQVLYFLLEGGNCVSLKLECDDAFLTVLREALAYLRSRQGADEDDDEESEEVAEVGEIAEN